jgi:hypothetical protein
MPGPAARRQHHSKLCDDLAEAGQLAELAAAFTNPDPAEHLTAVEPGWAVAMLYAITSFETFDAAAPPDQELTVLVPGIPRLAEAALRYPPGK